MKRTCNPTTEISADLAKKMLAAAYASVYPSRIGYRMCGHSPAEPKENGGEERHYSWSTVVGLALGGKASEMLTACVVC